MTTFDFAPDVPLAAPPEIRRDVLVVPWGLNEPRGAKRSAGLFDAGGAYLPQGACLRYDDDPLTIEPEFDRCAPEEPLAGRWLYGGMLYGHFGHFLCESTARLWALEDQDVEGVIWLPKIARTHAARMTRPFLPFFAQLGFPDLKLIAPQRPVRVAEMVLPQQGFGIGAMAAGKPQYRAFMRAHLGASVAAEGGERLYISRSGLPGKRGSVLMETAIESALEAEGYEIFHPEAHPIEVQIARYKAARRIVALDGSALHLAAMLVAPDTRVAIINRGPSQNIDDYARQFAAFAGIGICRIDAVRAFWSAADRRIVKREVHALLDMPAVGAALAAAGFVRNGAWRDADEAGILAEIAAREAHAETSMRRHDI